MPTDVSQLFDLRAHWEREYFGNSLAQWAAAAAILVVAYLALLFVRRRLRIRAAHWAESHANDGWILLRDLSLATKKFFLFVLAIYWAASMLTLPVRIRGLLHSAAVLVFLLQAGLWLGVLFRVGLDRWMRTRVRQDPAGIMLVTVVGYMGRLVIWSLILVLMLENLGVQVTALVTGLGIGGAAIALASQSILSDLFASLSIVSDQPFLLGDYILVGDMQGTVEQIGMKTVRIRSLTGEQLVIPNHDLLQSRIRNFQRLQQRRVQFNFTVFPDVPIEKLAALPELVKRIIEAQPDVRFERAHLQAFGDFGVRYEVAYHVLSPDYTRYMDIQQAINLELLRQMQSHGLAIAYQKGLLGPTVNDEDVDPPLPRKDFA